MGVKTNLPPASPPPTSSRPRPPTLKYLPVPIKLRRLMRQVLEATDAEIEILDIWGDHGAKKYWIRFEHVRGWLEETGVFETELSGLFQRGTFIGDYGDGKVFECETFKR